MRPINSMTSNPTHSQPNGGHSAAVDLAALHLSAMLSADHPMVGRGRDWANENIPARLDRFDADVWKRAGRDGVFAFHMPRELGGQGLDPVESLLFFEGLGSAPCDMGMIFALATQVFATQTALVRGATAEQRDRWLPLVLSGDVVTSFAMTEPDAGSDTAAIATIAEPTGEGTYRLNGQKAWISLAPIADAVLVFATTDQSIGSWGVTAFMIETSRPGVTLSDPVQKMGLSSCPFGNITFTNVELSDHDLIGTVGSGQRIFATAVEAERAFLYAAQIGRMRSLIDMSVQRARGREQGGKPIGAFQAVSHRIAGMQLQYESARLLLYKTAVLYSQGQMLTMASALAKLHISEQLVNATIDTMRTFGAYGYTVDAGIEVEIRDALGGLAYSGTSDIQKNIVASLLGVGRPLRKQKQK